MRNIRATWKKLWRSQKRARALARVTDHCRLEVVQLEERTVLSPGVVVISLDGATPALVNQYIDTGVLPANQGLGYLRSNGLQALRNETVNPSLTAPGHIAIATGSTAANNDV